MKNLNIEQTKAIYGGASWEWLSWAEPAWDFAKGIGQGFVDYAKNFAD